MNIKTLGVIAIVAAAVSAPAFAQDTAAPKHPLHHYRNAYNQAPGYVAPRTAEANPENSVDRSRVGGFDADFNPAN
jgi:hypothetical protein